MPSLYQGVCDNCGHKTAIMTAGYGAVLVDEPVTRQQHEAAGAVIMTGTRGPLSAVQDPRFVVLTHPIESSVLASTGYSKMDLVREGRYVEVTNVICRRCGTVFQSRRLAAPFGIGCGAGLVLGVALGVIVGFPSRSFMLGLLACYAVAALIGFIGTGLAALYVRRRHQERAAALAGEVHCPTCRADDAVPIDGAKGLRCSSCGLDALRFVFAGKS